jgi:hypothetical protein
VFQEICGGRIGMQLSEGRVHSGVRAHHVCTENADVTICLPMESDMILEKPA